MGKQATKNEIAGRFFVTTCAGFIILVMAAVVLFIALKGLAAFSGPQPLSLPQFLFSPNWQPEKAQFGALVFLAGSITVSLLAVLVSTPLSLMTAVFITQISPKIGERLLRPALELLVGVPSVVYGWVGLTVLVPAIRTYLGGIGFSVLAGGIVLAVMILPTITTLATDALRGLPGSLSEGSLALGATRWQTIQHVLIPAARARIGVAITLGLARAFGEALAVQMVIGNSVALPSSLLRSTTTLTSLLTLDMSNTVMGTAWNNVLWTMALLLLVITMGLILLVRRMGVEPR